MLDVGISFDPLFPCAGAYAPSGVVTLTDSNAFRYVNVSVPEGRLTVDLWAEDDRNPEWVWIQLGGILSI